MVTIEIDTPRSIDLINLAEKKESDIKNILQSVNIYDKVKIYKEKNQTDIIIKSKEELDDEIKEKIKKLIGLFSKYTGIDIDGLTLEVEWDKNDILRVNENVLAGILVGLNVYYKSFLPNHELLLDHELIYLANRIDSMIAYYVVCGFRKISYNGKIYKNRENIYNRYILIEYLKEERERLRNFIIENSDIDYDVSNNYNFYFLAIKNNQFSTFPIAIKREFDSKVVTVQNASHKVFEIYTLNPIWK